MNIYSGLLIAALHGSAAKNLAKVRAINAGKVLSLDVGCSKEFPHQFTTFCDCGHLIEIEHDLENARFYDSTNPYIRYFDLLPLENPDSLFPLDQEFTPTHHARELGKRLGLPWLYLKNETVLPTRTTKDRMAIAALSFMREVGVKAFATSSTGNSSTALGHYATYYPECKVYLFNGEDFLHRVNFEENENVIVFALRDATFVEAFEEAKAFAARTGIVAERGFFNPSRREGLKTAFFEAAETIPRPIHWYVQAISSAMGVYGTYKGAKELLALGKIERLPRLLCVQQATCNPMARAFSAESEVIRHEDVVERPYGIASSILRGNPTRAYPYIRQIVIESSGTIMEVTEEHIRDARRMVEETEGISPCFTASVAVAGLILLAKKGEIPSEHTLLINLTGGDREGAAPPRNVHWLRRGPAGWCPADANDSLAREFYGKPQ